MKESNCTFKYAAMARARKKKKGNAPLFIKLIGRYLINILISLDQLGNTILLGSPDETISSRIGRLKLNYGGSIPWTRPVTKLTDWLLDKIDPNHTIDAIENHTSCKRRKKNV